MTSGPSCCGPRASLATRVAAQPAPAAVEIGADLGPSRVVRALGLDVGSKTIGVAVSDELGIAAHPLEVLARRGTGPDVQAVLTIAVRQQVEAVVVGIPYDMDGNEGHRAQRVRVFANALRAALPTDIAMHDEDERFSTVTAENVLIEANLSRKRRKEIIDKQAAAVILQAWLDRRRPTS